MDYDMDVLNTMTVQKYLELMSTDDEEKHDEASDAMADIHLYLYANVDCVSDLEIDETEIDDKDNTFIMSLSFETGCEDVNMIQKDVDDFITTDVEASFDDTVDFHVESQWTFKEIADKIRDEIERKAESLIEHAVEEAAEEYREFHHSRGDYWI